MDEQRRRLELARLRDAVEECRRLQTNGYRPVGNWTLGQVCQHLRRVQEGSLDGYPGWMSLFAPLRPLIRRWLLPRILSPESPAGIRTAGVFVPAAECQDVAEMEQFAASVERFLVHPGEFHSHPGFGRLDREMLERVHAAHAAHHLGFLIPNNPETDP